MDIIRAAERGHNLPRPVMSGHNSFSSLTYSILKTFVEHKYLMLREKNLELLALQSQISDELGFARDYLEIQRIRYHDRFRVTWEIGPGTETCRVIKLLLQPLVENAISHGIRARQGRGVIRVLTARENGRLKLSVSDDGVGIPA